MRVKMTPTLQEANGAEGGISTLVRAYYKHMPTYGVEFVDNDDLADLFAVHAGMREDVPGDRPMVAHLHGLYWTADYVADRWEYQANAYVINSLRVADLVTVPSDWVGQSIRRDMHLSPMVVGHGIDLVDWTPQSQPGEYVIWNKNRDSDVCNPEPVNELAKRFPKRLFLSTFSAPNPTPNIKVTGVMPHSAMKLALQGAGIYLATTKETFGIGTLEAMATGLPVLGFNWGGTADLVKHEVNGYLAKPGDYDDLAEGLVYCMRNRSRLAAGSLLEAQAYSWDNIIKRLVKAYRGLLKQPQRHSVAVVIPCFNYGDKLERAVRSVLSQSYKTEIIIVDNNSTDNTEQVARSLAAIHSNITYYNCPDQGVAHARNYGITRTQADYICCLDADDTIESEFIRTCVDALKNDATVGVAYTKMMVHDLLGRATMSGWPDGYNYGFFMEGQNQIPTCSVFRRKAWERLGGYRQRYAPYGQGAEDAEFYLRMGAIGYKGVQASAAPMFNYYLGGRTQSEPYFEVDWRGDKSWISDKKYPFASVAPAFNISHPVRQYDVPLISVVIPVISTHEKLLYDALDSLEGQSFKRWEAIVVCDGFEPYQATYAAYPFARFIKVAKQGAGGCRNVGAEKAKAPLLFFLDADDWIEPECLGTMFNFYQQEPRIIYSDYFGHAVVDVEMAKQLDGEGKLVEYWSKTKQAKFRNQASDFDRPRAIRQPDAKRNDWYIWSLISSLVAKEVHESIGGFDVAMESWEDWDYWIRAARMGFNFGHIPVPLVHYRYGTGVRRTIGEQKFNELTAYLTQKYQGENHGRL